ncbi:MAG: serine/threonine-protein kinase [Myxococcota bacterium]
MPAETTRPYRQSSEDAGRFEEAQTDVVEVHADIGRGGTAPSLAATAPPEGSATRLPPGTRVGRYLVLGHIGSGGLGDVYAAFDSELDRKVAIKLLKPDAHDKALGDPTQRLLREAQALAKLRHPNVVTVFDVGTFRDEVFVAMEFVEGRTVTAWLRETNPGWEQIRDVYLLAGEGLAAAHAAGLVHRDFKLDNVIVGNDGHVTVLDFGLARAIGRVDSGDIGTMPIPLSAASMNAPMNSLLDRDVTKASLVLGTPPYMSPELLTGEPASGSTDQFAFCVALFKGLHRRLPFVATTLAEHYDAVTAGRISTGPDDSGVPGWLRKVVERGLEPDPRRRFASMDALLFALVADRRRRRRRLVYLAIFVPLLSVGVAAAAIATRPEPTQTERALTLELAEQARAAAANGYYVFPPSDAPDTPTALTKVVELESLDGAISKEGKRVGKDLRSELSEALARLGDRYYDRPGGPAFAADFYAAAILFNPDHARARERVNLTPGQLSEWARRAQQGDFTSGELRAAEALAVLAIEDGETRTERVREYFGDKEAASVTQPAALEALLDEDERAVAEAAKRTRAKRRRNRLEPSPPATAAKPEADATKAAPPDEDLDRSSSSELGITFRARCIAFATKLRVP